MPIFNASAIPDLLSSENDGNIEHNPIVIEERELFCTFSVLIMSKNGLFMQLHVFF